MRRRRRINWSRRILCGMFFVLSVLILNVFIATLCWDRQSMADENFDTYMRDDMAPTIELSGGDMKVAIGERFTELGYEVYDNTSLPLVEIDSDVNVKQEGDYEIVYHASDLSGNSAEVIRKVQVVQPAGWIYLTFDDGPSDYTATLLDVLKKYGVKATFFVTGAGEDDLIRREMEEGHAVGLHSMTHDYAYIYSDIANYFADLDGIRGRVERLTGINTHLLRFPGGSSNMISAYYDGGSRIMSHLVDEVSARNYTYFDWNVDSNDAGGATTADEVYKNVIAALKPGSVSVILQHDTKAFSVEAVERIIQYGVEHNYMFDKLDVDSFAAHHGVNN